MCNAKGKTLVGLFKKIKVTSDKITELKSILGFTQKEEVVHDKTKVELPKEYKPLINLARTDIAAKHALMYLKKRGITIFDIIKYRIGFCDSGEYSGKIIIPSYDSEGQLNYFVSRGYYSADLHKHKNPKVSKDIIGFEMFINWEEPIILCEGSFDAIAVKRNAIPLFGKIIQPALQKKIIQERVQDIYICLDADALKNAIQIAEKFMSEGLNVYFIKLDNEDASELGFKKINEIIANTDILTFESLMHLKMEQLWK